MRDSKQQCIHRYLCGADPENSLNCHVDTRESVDRYRIYQCGSQIGEDDHKPISFFTILRFIHNYCKNYEYSNSIVTNTME